MMICHSCNGQVQPQARFCDQCGATLKGPGETVFESGQQNHGKFRRWVIGGSAECDLVVNDQKVSARHCLLIETPDGFLLQDLGSTNGTFVNGQKITSQVNISRSDKITLGHAAAMPWPQREVPRDVIQNVTADPKAKVIRIGGEADNDVVLDYPMVSGHHARITIVNGAAVIEDLNSTNGTAIGNPKNKIKRSPLSLKDVVYFGSLRQPASRLIGGKLTLGTKAQAELAFTGQTMTIGRDPKCDLALDYPMVSWQHARLTRAGNQITVEDLGSTNGTFVNGQRISGVVTVKPDDVIGLGSYTFHLTQAGRLEKRDYRGNLTIEGAGITVEVPGKRLIEDISLTIYPSELVGLMGRAGAGKTTLMSVLNGYTPPAKGVVLCNGKDLYDNYAQFRGQVGYVPQDDIMHRELTVGQALYYTARLRLPNDFSDTEIRQRISQVLTQLDMQGKEDVLIGSPERKGISGGERKRVNLAMELLADPSVLFLDEPTSGLASEDALTVMKVLRQLADTGKTILLTIHQPSLEVYSLMDNLVVISRDASTADTGKLVYYGPAYPDAVYFFNPGHQGRIGSSMEQRPMPDEVLRGLGTATTGEWVTRYNASDYKREYVTERAGKRATDSPTEPTGAKQPVGVSQWWTLVRRCFEVKLKDKWGTGILLAQAPIIAILIVAVFGRQTNQSVTGNDSFWKIAASMKTTIFLMSLAALWFGCSNSAREIVGEWAIFRRERMVNLKIPSYVVSKFTVLGGLCLIQCLILLGIGYLGCGLRGPLLAMYGVLVLTALNGVGMGLMVSALAKTSEVAVALIPIILLPMIILGGSLKARYDMTWPGMSQPFASRWAFEALLLLEAENRENYPYEKEKQLKMALQDKKLNDLARQIDTDYLPQVDMAHNSFPAFDQPDHNITQDRSGVAMCVAILSAMLLTLMLVILVLLRWRDIRP